MDPSGNSWISTIINTVKNVVQQAINVVNTVVSTIKTNLVRKNNIVLANKNKLPTKGKPNSSVTNSKGDTRVYGPDGKALKDIDVSHPHRHPELQNPHEHDWEWDGDRATRGKPHNFANIGIGIGVGVGIGLGGYVIYRGVRMLPSLVPALWWTIPANAVMP